MKTKYLTLLLLVSLAFAMLPMLTIRPAFATHPEIVVFIDGQPSWQAPVGKPYVITGEATCTTFEIEVALMNVMDVFAYEFTIDWTVGYWDDPITPAFSDGLINPLDYIELESFEYKEIWTDSFIAEQKVYKEAAYPWRAYAYKQAATSLDAEDTFSGTTAIANLVFHIIQDVCYPFQVYFEFLVDGMLFGPCGEPTDPSTEHGYLKFHPLQPVITLIPRLDGESGWIEDVLVDPVTRDPYPEGEERKKVVKWVYCSEFWVDVYIENAIAMKSFYFNIEWTDYWQLDTDIQQVEITDFLPKPYEWSYLYVGDDFIDAAVWMPCEKDPISGSGIIMTIKFHANNPWKFWWMDLNFNGVRDPGEVTLMPPDYVHELEPPYHYFPEKCSDAIYIDGVIDVYSHPDDTLHPWPQCLKDEVYGVHTIDPVFYAFTPIPGDLNLDGHVDLQDLQLIAMFYGLSDTIGTLDLDPIDLVDDGVIDIADIIVVSKWFCTEEPPEYDP